MKPSVFVSPYPSKSPKAKKYTHLNLKKNYIPDFLVRLLVSTNTTHSIELQKFALDCRELEILSWVGYSGIRLVLTFVKIGQVVRNFNCEALRPW
jgi:hypothetical protein